MFRSLSMLRRNILMSRIIYSNCTARATLLTSARIRAKPKDILSNDATITDINIHDLAKGDPDFTRNFLTSLSSLSQSLPSSTDAAVEPPSADNAEAPAQTTDSIADEGINNSSVVLDKDGMPIVPIEIDGWKHYEDEDVTVQNSGGHIEIGNDNDYKADNMLQVPEKREGQFEYKGIKMKLPETASNDIGTYRFRRDKGDLESVADDIRLVKYDKK